MSANEPTETFMDDVVKSSITELHSVTARYLNKEFRKYFDMKIRNGLNGNVIVKGGLLLDAEYGSPFLVLDSGVFKISVATAESVFLLELNAKLQEFVQKLKVDGLEEGAELASLLGLVCNFSVDKEGKDLICRVWLDYALPSVVSH